MGLHRKKKRRAEICLQRLALLLEIPIELAASERGKRLERHVVRKCKRLGFQVIDHSSKGRPYDLLVNGLRVQCKNRNKHGHNGHGVNLFKNSQKRYSTSEVDFFVIRFTGACFVIPSLVIADSRGLVHSWVKLTDKRHFIDAWSQLSGSPIYLETQMNLFVKESQDGRRMD